MAFHSKAAEGDRHPPVDRNFANAAARIAYAYTSDDIGKWYKDEDTDTYWELTSDYLPGFSQVTAVGTALYNFPFKVITVDSNEPSADYSTIAAAIAAAVSGDVISVGPGTYTCDNQTLPAGVDLVGYGMDITFLTTTGATALTVGDDSHVASLTVTSVNASGNSWPIVLNGANTMLDSVKGNATDSAGSNSAHGIHVTVDGDTILLMSCMGLSNAASSGGSYGIYIDGVGIEIHQGRFYGNNNAVFVDVDGDVAFNVPMLIGSNPIAGTGILQGTYVDAIGNIVVGRYETGSLPTPGQGGRLMYDITTGHLILDVGLSLIDPP